MRLLKWFGRTEKRCNLTVPEHVALVKFICELHKANERLLSLCKEYKETVKAGDASYLELQNEVASLLRKIGCAFGRARDAEDRVTKLLGYIHAEMGSIDIGRFPWAAGTNEYFNGFRTVQAGPAREVSVMASCKPKPKKGK
jgi:hypothetical protein